MGAHRIAGSWLHVGRSFTALTLFTAAAAFTVVAAAPPDDEWTFEAAQRCWSPMVHPVMHVGVPGYSLQCGMMWDGSLLFGPLCADFPAMAKEIEPLGAPMQLVSFGFGERCEQVDRAKAVDPRARRSLLEGRLPIPRFDFDDAGLRWSEQLFAQLLDRPLAAGMTPRDDDRMLVHSLWRVENASPLRRTAQLWIHFGTLEGVAFGYKTTLPPGFGTALPQQWHAPIGLLDGRLRYLIPPPTHGELAWRDEKQCVAWTVDLAPGEVAELRLLLPYGSLAIGKADALLALDSHQELAKARTFWAGLEQEGARITTPDPFFNDYLAAVAGNMTQQITWRRESGVWMYKTSPNHYEMLWPCNAAKALPALDFRGLARFSEPVLSGFVQMQTDDVGGLARRSMGTGEVLAGEGYAKLPGFLGNFREWTANPLLLSHGLGMWALARHFRITRDASWFGGGPGSPRQAVVDAFQWVASQRRRTMREWEGGAEGPIRARGWGLLPAASAHDWLAGNAFFNDAFCVYGMTEVVRALSEVGAPDLDAMVAELADYRRCLRDRTAESRDRAVPVAFPDGTQLPFVPRLLEELDWRNVDWTYTGYGPLRCGAWGVFDPHDEIVDQALVVLEAGFPRGEGAYFSAPATYPDLADRNWADISDATADRHWLWRHYVEYETMWPIGGPLFLARDDLPRYFEWLFHNFAAVLHREWRVGVESLDGVPSCAPGDGERWQLVRAMFVNERGGFDGSTEELFLCQALPRDWLKPGAHLGVTDMRTVFGGLIDVDLEVDRDGASCTARVSWRHFAVEPQRIVLRLRSGSGAPLATATIDGETAPISDDNLVTLPSGKSGSCTVVGSFRSTDGR